MLSARVIVADSFSFGAMTVVIGIWFFCRIRVPEREPGLRMVDETVDVSLMSYEYENADGK